MDPDARLQLPDYQVSFRNYSIVLGEFKTAMASPKLYQDDYVKLVFMGKKAVDGLYKAGYPIPVVLIHGRGMLMDVYTLGLVSEATYHLQSLGTFHLVSGPYQFWYRRPGSWRFEHLGCPSRTIYLEALSRSYECRRPQT